MEMGGQGRLWSCDGRSLERVLKALKMVEHKATGGSKRIVLPSCFPPASTPRRVRVQGETGRGVSVHSLRAEGRGTLTPAQTHCEGSCR